MDFEDLTGGSCSSNGRQSITMADNQNALLLLWTLHTSESGFYHPSLRHMYVCFERVAAALLDDVIGPGGKKDCCQ